VKAGEKIYLSIVQPTQSDLQNGSNDESSAAIGAKPASDPCLPWL